MSTQPPQMNPEPQPQQPVPVQIALHIFYSVKAFPSMLFGGLVGVLTAILSDREVFMLVAGVVLLSFVLPIFYTLGGGLMLYAVLRTINDWIRMYANAQAQQLTQIAQVLNDEKRVAIVQVPEVLTRKLPDVQAVESVEYEGNPTTND